MLKHVKFKYKILLMPFLAIIAFLLLLFVSQLFMGRNNALLSEIEQSFVPALELSHDLERTLTDLQRSMQDAVAAADEEELSFANTSYEHILTLFEKVRTNSFFAQDQLTALIQEFEAYYTLANSTSQQLIAGGTLDEETVAKLGEMSEQYNVIKAQIQTMVLQAKQEASRTFEATLQNYKQSSYFMNLIIACSVLVLGILSLLTARSISRPIQEAIRVTAQFAEGSPTVRIPVTGHDELSELGRAFNRMMDTLAMQNWFKTGQATLNERMRGEQEVAVLSRNIISYLATYTQSQIGAIYLMDEEQKTLHLTGSYAYTQRKGNRNAFQPGEGLVGQVALEKQRILFTQVPEDYIAIQSGLGETPPRYLLILPLLHENVLKGVIELGAVHEFSTIETDFLEQSCESIAIALHSAQSRVKLQALLQETQQQSEALQAQQEELRHTNEELEAQARALKASEEKLQMQQEELKQTNEELEEQARILEMQKAELSEKNQELELSRKLIEEKAKELDLTSKYKSEFLANMSHELRTPLNSLLILSKLLLENKEANLTDKQLEFIRTIHSSGAELLALINDVLDLSKVEAGKMVLNFEEMSLIGLGTFIEQNFRHVAEQRALGLRVSLAEDLPSSIFTDRQRVEQIVKNFLSNAMKFTEQGEVHVQIHRPHLDTNFFRKELSSQQAVAIAVSDTGIGIPPDKQHLIFEAFQQADGTTSRKYGGTGLGLSISREIVKLLGGEIHLQSEVGKGSTFTLYLPETAPAAQQEQALPTPERSIQGDRLTNISRQTIPSPENRAVSAPPTDLGSIRDDRRDLTPDQKSLLIIEDDPKFAKILFDLARERGFKGLIAGDGSSGLHLAYQYVPSAIMLDINLPELDGRMVMDKLKKNPETRHIPVHFISVLDASLEAMKMGAIGYLTKPVSLEQLREAFEKIEDHLTRTIKELLIVEDDEAMRNTMVELLHGKDLLITTAATGQQAHRLLREQHFDCVVLDLGLTDMSGFDLLEQIRQDPEISDFPIIVYTGRDLTHDEELELKRYADSIILKGVQSHERLLDEVTLFLHRVEKNLPESQKRALRILHDKETVFHEKTILLVDDDVRNIFALSSVLEDKGLSVLAAGNGREALDMLASHPEIDLVLMDIMMPEMDGYETMQHIRKQPEFSKLPIIALTAKAMKGDRQRCIEAGASDYLSKPVESEKLLSLLRVWLY
ncbi:putative signal transduction histidine kinase [Candidatus Vecturithrix granuli]|uniref:histidine kinase n=1 Tax=Vecturithrix granuli TaxID=1499967 RepID=A0A081C2P0_VECG1|nr:putative signal transduction histidine kinase [Candidatus Vecturithrix granuli]